MVDRITWISAEGGAHDRGEVHAELDIDPSLWFFECHFRGDPVMPGCLGLDAMWQLVGFFLAWSGHHGLGRALGVDEVRFTGQVLPTVKRVSYRIDITRVIARKLVMVTGDGSLLRMAKPSTPLAACASACSTAPPCCSLPNSREAVDASRRSDRHGRRLVPG